MTTTINQCLYWKLQPMKQDLDQDLFVATANISKRVSEKHPGPSCQNKDKSPLATRPLCAASHGECGGPLCHEDRKALPPYSVIGVLGAGASGRVERVYDDKHKKEFALKTIPRSHWNMYTETEIVNHSILQHPHVVQMGKVFASRDKLCIQMEYANAGSLFELVRNEELLDEHQARWFFQQLILALDYCHRRGVCHRDVKLENCVLSREPGLPLPLLKLCDFGFSKADFCGNAQSKVGTLGAMAPEVMSPATTCYDGAKADLWSAGVALYTMVAGRRPFDIKANHRARQLSHSARNQVVLQLMEGEQYASPVCSSGCRDLIAGLLKPRPEERLSMAEVLRHPWFQKSLPSDALKMNDAYCGLPGPCLEAQRALLQQLRALRESR